MFLYTITDNGSTMEYRGLWKWRYELWAAYWLTVSELLHVIIKHSLLQGTFVIGRDRVSTAIGCELSWPRHSKRPWGMVLSKDVLLSKAVRPPSITSNPSLASDPEMPLPSQPKTGREKEKVLNMCQLGGTIWPKKSNAGQQISKSEWKRI